MKDYISIMWYPVVGCLSTLFFGLRAQLPVRRRTARKSLPDDDLGTRQEMGTVQICRL